MLARLLASESWTFLLICCSCKMFLETRRLFLLLSVASNLQCKWLDFNSYTTAYFFVIVSFRLCSCYWFFFFSGWYWCKAFPIASNLCFSVPQWRTMWGFLLQATSIYLEETLVSFASKQPAWVLCTYQICYAGVFFETNCRCKAPSRALRIACNPI